MVCLAHISSFWDLDKFSSNFLKILEINFFLYFFRFHSGILCSNKEKSQKESVFGNVMEAVSSRNHFWHKQHLRWTRAVDGEAVQEVAVDGVAVQEGAVDGEEVQEEAVNGE